MCKKLSGFTSCLFNFLFHNVPHILRGFSFQADSPVSYYPCTSITPSCHQTAIHMTLFVGNCAPPLTPLPPTSFSPTTSSFPPAGPRSVISPSLKSMKLDYQIKTLTAAETCLPTPLQDTHTRCHARGSRPGHCPRIRLPEVEWSRPPVHPGHNWLLWSLVTTKH